MSALVTQTLDENLKILFIASPSRLAQLIVIELKQQSDLEIELISPQKFNLKEFNTQTWYKVVILFEHPWNFNQHQLRDWCFSPQRTVVIMPLTTAIRDKNHLAQAWMQQILKEEILFKKIEKIIDISRFIFYKDLVNKQVFPSHFFFQNLDQSFLVDPSLEINLQSRSELSAILAQDILRPQEHTKLIQGRSRISTSIIKKVKDFYARLYQINLPVKYQVINGIPHPILEGFRHQPQIIDVNNSINRMARDLLELVEKNKLKKKVDKKEEQILPPDKKDLVKTWNEVDFSPKRLNLDLEHDLTSGAQESELVPSSTIEKVFKKARNNQKQAHLKKLAKKTRIGFQKVRNQKFLFGGGIIVSVFALCLLLVTSLFLISVSNVHSGLLSYFESKSKPITAQEKQLSNLSGIVGRLESKLATTNKWLSIPLFSRAFQLIEIGSYIVDLNQQVTTFEDLTAEFFQQVMGQNVAGQSLDDVIRSGAEVFKTLSLLSAELKNYPEEKLSPEELQLVAEYQDLIETQEKKINQFQQLSPLLSELLALEGNKTYAILLQNDQELRPTGGFIQAVALLNFEQGQLVNYQVEDVYTIDQQLAAEISPPEEIKTYLNEDRWYLRDSNWNPSFPQAASQAKWFLAKSIGIQVDGVIGMNLRVLEEILGVLGQVSLDEYNEVLTKNNLAERMDFHSEVQLVETTKIKDYSELVLDKILANIQQLPNNKVTPLLSALTESADEQELLITVFDNDLQATFETLGWSGMMVNPACPGVFSTTSCLVDYLMQVEANVGVNKANYYLERQVDHSVFISSDEVYHKRVVTFKNKAQTNAWPKGTYRSYVRFYLPPEAELKSLLINNKVIPAENLKIKKELNRLLVGTFIEVPVKTEGELQLEYSLPHQEQAPFTYAFFDQKQSGARETSPRIFIQYEPDLSPTLIAPQAEVQGDVIVFNPSKDAGHMFVGVSFE